MTGESEDSVCEQCSASMGGAMDGAAMASRFACFASATQSATASLASAVDEERAKELLSGLGLMERVGVRVLQREQRKRDRSELLSRLQRARHNQLHVLSGPEQQQIKHIERHGEPTALALSCSRTAPD